MKEWINDPLVVEHTFGNPDVASIAGTPVARVRAALEAGAGRAPRHLDGLVVEDVGVGVGGGLDGGAGVALGLGDDVPLLARRPVEGAGGVEQPVAAVGDEGAEVRELALGREVHLGADDVGVGARRRHHLRVRRALHRVVQAAVEVQLQRRREDALLHVRRLELLEVAHARDRAHRVGLAGRLRREQLVGRCHERLPRALGRAGGREQARGERDEREKTLHRCGCSNFFFYL